MMRSCLVALVLAAPFSAAFAQVCDVRETEVFRPGTPTRETIVLARRDGGPDDSSVILFRTRLRVNTDGAPTSYHPEDLTGTSRAINKICHGVSVRGPDGRRLGCARTAAVFAQFRDNNWRAPAGHTIRWQNVIAATAAADGREIPCVFQSGEHRGFFGSLTTLRNGLPAAERGECLHRDQIDQRFVPGLVLPGGNNPLRQFGARIGDLVLAHNPANGRTRTAVIADSGPEDNLGEGSVALNMALLGVTAQPRTFADAVRLDTGSREILVAVIPGSRAFRLARPFSAENIAERVSGWAANAGYRDAEGLLAFALACAPR